MQRAAAEKPAAAKLTCASAAAMRCPNRRVTRVCDSKSQTDNNLAA